MEPAADTILSPVAPEPAPAETCGCCTEEPGGGWESRSVSVSEEAEPGGAETGFSLDISPWKQGGEERSPLSLTPALQAASAAAQKTSTARGKNKGGRCFKKPLNSPYPPENVYGLIRLAEEGMEV